MYSGDLKPRERAAPALAVVLVHLALGAMLLGLSGHLAPSAVDSALKVIDLSRPESPPPPPPPPPPPERRASAPKPRAAAPPAPKVEATPIVAPKPVVVIPVTPPIATAPVPAQGAAPSQGASTAGTGSGAGGVGNGTGGGGNGSGGTGEDAGGTHPRPRFRPLDPRGFPRVLVEPLPPDTRVMIIFDVELNGRISNCAVRQASGSPALDALLCRVASDRFRYEPARHADGTPYVAKAAYLLVF